MRGVGGEKEKRKASSHTAHTINQPNHPYKPSCEQCLSWERALGASDTHHAWPHACMRRVIWLICFCFCCCC